MQSIETERHIMAILLVRPIRMEFVWGFERWCVSAHRNADCEVLNEQYGGHTLSDLWKNNRELFGNVTGKEYPLLTKIIEARDNLSVQVHPNDVYAAKHENGASGKYECWYVLDCNKDSKIIIGHNAQNREMLEHMIRNREWGKLLREIPIKKGDFFQIDAGVVHAIEGGTTILETQQNSDITYRLYDYDRLVDGKPRQLHLEKSIACIASPFTPAKNDSYIEKVPGGIRTELIKNAYYSIEKYDIYSKIEMNENSVFSVFSVIEGEGIIDRTPVSAGMNLIVTANSGKLNCEGKFSAIRATPAANKVFVK
jgi:mannose-6-phosphate isomerase